MSDQNNLLQAAKAAEPDLAARRATRQRRFLILFGVLACVALAVGLYWLLSGRYSEDTDDAYVGGNLVQIAAQVQGTVTDVLVDNTQQVKAGQPLVKLDDADAAVALAQARAGLAQAVRQAANTKLSNAVYVETVRARQADLTLAQRELAARSNASVEVVSPEELARARSQEANAQAQLASAQAQLAAAQMLDGKQPIDEVPAVVQAAAQFKLAYRNWKRTVIVAPIDGTVGQLSAQVGQQVGPGVPLMSVVQLSHLWVEANFKEGQIRHMRVGQPVQIVSDIYGSRVVYHGHVSGFSAGTGSAFSMLPAQNAAGNWVKVVQRVPVVIALDPADLVAHPLRVGLSMAVTVDTHKRDGAMLDNETSQHAQTSRVHDDLSAEADAAAAEVIRENGGA